MFTINNEIWRIKFVPSHSSILYKSNGIKSVAVTNYDTKTIYLSSELYGNFLKKVLCHEIVHTFIFSSHIYLDIYQEEQLADFISIYGRDIIHITDEIYNRIIN